MEEYLCGSSVCVAQIVETRHDGLAMFHKKIQPVAGGAFCSEHKVRTCNLIKRKQMPHKTQQ